MLRATSVSSRRSLGSAEGVTEAGRRLGGQHPGFAELARLTEAANLVRELANVDRLFEIAVEARREEPLAAFPSASDVIATTGMRRGSSVAFQPAHDVRTVQVREPDIQEDHVGTIYGRGA